MKNDDLEEIKKLIFDEEETYRQKYEKLVSGKYGVIEMYDEFGDICGYRGFVIGQPLTDVFPTYREAIEAAMELDE
jgi:hypothetical protein